MPFPNFLLRRMTVAAFHRQLPMKKQKQHTPLPISGQSPFGAEVKSEQRTTAVAQTHSGKPYRTQALVQP